MVNITKKANPLSEIGFLTTICKTPSYRSCGLTVLLLFAFDLAIAASSDDIMWA